MAKNKDKKPGTKLEPVKAKAELQPWEETLDEKRGHIWGESNEALREKLEEVQEWFDRESRHSIKARWELGVIINDIHDDVTNHRGNRYGVHAVDRIAKYFGWDKTSIYNSLKLAQIYTEDEIDGLCERRMPDGQLLSYSHLLSVIAMPREERKKLLDKAVAESLTSTELGRLVVHGKEPARLQKDDKRGRPIGKPKTFDAEASQIESFVSDFLSRAEQVWYSDDYSLDAKIAEFENDDYTEERTMRVKGLAEQMKKLWEMGKKLEEFLRHIHGIFIKIRKETTPAPKMIGTPESKQKSTKDDAK